MNAFVNEINVFLKKDSFGCVQHTHTHKKRNNERGINPPYPIFLFIYALVIVIFVVAVASLYIEFPANFNATL